MVVQSIVDKNIFFLCRSSQVSLKLLWRLKSTGWCVLGCWLTNYSVQTSFFLVAASWWQWNERHVMQIYTVDSQSHSAALDRNRAARFEWGVAWTFACKTHEIEKSSKFKSCEYGGQSAKNGNSANSRWAVLVVQASTESAERCIFHQDMSLWIQWTTCCLKSS